MRCPTCGRIIAQRETLSGKPVVLDPRPKPEGDYALAAYTENTDMEGRVVRLGGRILREARVDQVPLYRAHRCTLRVVA